MFQHNCYKREIIAKRRKTCVELHKRRLVSGVGESVADRSGSQFWSSKQVNHGETLRFVRRVFDTLQLKMNLFIIDRKVPSPLSHFHVFNFPRSLLLKNSFSFRGWLHASFNRNAHTDTWETVDDVGQARGIKLDRKQRRGEKARKRSSCKVHNVKGIEVASLAKGNIIVCWGNQSEWDLGRKWSAWEVVLNLRRFTCGKTVLNCSSSFLNWRDSFLICSNLTYCSSMLSCQLACYLASKPNLAPSPAIIIWNSNLTKLHSNLSKILFISPSILGEMGVQKWFKMSDKSLHVNLNAHLLFIKLEQCTMQMKNSTFPTFRFQMNAKNFELGKTKNEFRKLN
jgi:hypothetical protein